MDQTKTENSLQVCGKSSVSVLLELKNILLGLYQLFGEMTLS